MHKAKHAGSGMHLIASVVARLSKYREGFGIKVYFSCSICVSVYRRLTSINILWKVVDSLLEDIAEGLLRNDPAWQVLVPGSFHTHLSF